MSSILPMNDEAIIKKHRDEAGGVKECFTQFSFQAMAVSGIVLGAIAAYQPSHPAVGFAGVLILLLALAVARIGNYKYATANRHYGYELHLARTRDVESDSPGGWKKHMRDIGWEEAMRAWRVVQASVFSQLYRTAKNRPNRLRDEYRGIVRRWFEPATLLPPDSEYYAGSYLLTMHRFLHMIAVLSILPVAAMVVQYASPLVGKWLALRDLSSFGHFLRYSLHGLAMLLLSVLCLGFAIVYATIRIRRNRARREILEKGFLSIHSSAIMWQAVVLAHFRAKQKAEARSGTLECYTWFLGEEAAHLRLRILQIHRWVMDPETVEPDDLSGATRVSCEKEEPPS